MLSHGKPLLYNTMSIVRNIFTSYQSELCIYSMFRHTEANLQGVLWSYVPLRVPKIRYGVWSEKKGFRGTDGSNSIEHLFCLIINFNWEKKETITVD